MAKTITVTITEDATISVDLNGFHGKGCGDVIKLFDGIGTQTKSGHKPEWNEQTHNANVTRSGQ